MDYFVVVRDYVPVILSTLFMVVIATLVPQSLRRIRSRARKELNEIRYHRCYAVDSLTAVCCCKPKQQVELEKSDEGEKVEEVKKVDLVQLINQLEVKTTTLAPAGKSLKRVDEDREQLQPVHVTQIAKIFENGDGSIVKRNKVFRRRPNSEYSDNNHIIVARQSVTRRPISEYFESTKLSKVDDVDDENVENHQVNGAVKRKPISEYFQPKIVPKENGHHEEMFGNEITNGVNEISIEEEEEILKMIEQEDDGIVKRKNRSNGPVTSIDEILAQKRLSRPLSAYSITDLLSDSITDDVYVENFFNNLVAK